MNEVKLVNVGTIPMMGSMRNGVHFVIHGDYKKCVENFLPANRRAEIGYDTVYIPLFKLLAEVNNRVIPENERRKRDMHVRSADKIYRKLVLSVAGRAGEYDDNVICEAKTINSIIRAYGDLRRFGISNRIEKYANFLAKLDKNPRDIDIVNVRHLVEDLREEIKYASQMRAEIVDYWERGRQNKTKVTRKAIDAAYRNAMAYLNSCRAIDGATDCEAFMSKWDEYVEKHKRAYAPLAGLRISKRANAEESAASPTPRRSNYYTLPKSNTTRTFNAGAVKMPGGNPPPEPDIPANPSDIPLYDPSKHFTEYKLGELVRLENGDIYKVINLGHVHYHPDSKYGHHGWVKVN